MPASDGVKPKSTRRRSPASQAEFRQEMLLRAKEIYRNQGYAALTVRAMTQAMGMSPMAFYSYFPSKQALVGHIWVDIFRELMDELLAAGRDSGSPRQTLRAHVTAFIEYWERHNDHYRMVYGVDGRTQSDVEPDIANDPVYTQVIDLFRERVVACAVNGSVPEQDARQITGLVMVKLLGYLHARLGLRRGAAENEPAFRELLIHDVVKAAERAVFDAVRRAEKAAAAVS
jgi:AcrR family transcriptional regulator